MKTIDVNSDIGEGYGPYRIAPDAELMPMITSANIACGGHAGDPVVMDDTISLAMAHDVCIGAHIGYPDRAGFGRRHIPMTPRELELMAVSQIGALAAIADFRGTRLTHFNFHGALGNLTFADPDVSAVLLRAVKAFDSSLIYIGVHDTEAIRIAEKDGFKTVRSFLADRGYSAPGRLAPRGTQGALIKDPDAVRRRVTETLSTGKMRLTTGEEVDVDVESVLVHSDTPRSLELAEAIRMGIQDSGHAIGGYTKA